MRVSYSRWGDSDLYLILHTGRYYACYSCSIAPHAISWRGRTTGDALAHVQHHIDRGDRVPSDLIPRLRADQAANDRWLTGTAEPEAIEGLATNG